MHLNKNTNIFHLLKSCESSKIHCFKNTKKKTKNELTYTKVGYILPTKALTYFYLFCNRPSSIDNCAGIFSLVFFTWT